MAVQTINAEIHIRRGTYDQLRKVYDPQNPDQSLSEGHPFQVMPGELAIAQDTNTLFFRLDDGQDPDYTKANTTQRLIEMPFQANDLKVSDRNAVTAGWRKLGTHSGSMFCAILTVVAGDGLWRCFVHRSGNAASVMSLDADPNAKISALKYVDTADGGEIWANVAADCTMYAEVVDETTNRGGTSSGWSFAPDFAGSEYEPQGLYIEKTILPNKGWYLVRTSREFREALEARPQTGAEKIIWILAPLTISATSQTAWQVAINGSAQIYGDTIHFSAEILANTVSGWPPTLRFYNRRVQFSNAYTRIIGMRLNIKRILCTATITPDLQDSAAVTWEESYSKLSIADGEGPIYVAKAPPAAWEQKRWDNTVEDTYPDPAQLIPDGVFYVSSSDQFTAALAAAVPAGTKKVVWVLNPITITGNVTEEISYQVALTSDVSVYGDRITWQASGFQNNGSTKYTVRFFNQYVLFAYGILKMKNVRLLMKRAWTSVMIIQADKDNADVIYEMQYDDQLGAADQGFVPGLYDLPGNWTRAMWDNTATSSSGSSNDTAVYCTSRTGEISALGCIGPNNGGSDCAPLVIVKSGSIKQICFVGMQIGAGAQLQYKLGSSETWASLGSLNTGTGSPKTGFAVDIPVDTGDDIKFRMQGNGGQAVQITFLVEHS